MPEIGKNDIPEDVLRELRHRYGADGQALRAFVAHYDKLVEAVGELAPALRCYRTERYIGLSSSGNTTFARIDPQNRYSNSMPVFGLSAAIVETYAPSFFQHSFPDWAGRDNPLVGIYMPLEPNEEFVDLLVACFFNSCYVPAVKKKFKKPEVATPKQESPRLTAITIENFKGIGAPVTVPLRPMTLLFGANSAGKSTVIQALQYAWEILENGNPDVDRTRLGGEAIDLGGFRNIVHGHQLDRVIRIGFMISGDITAYSGAHFLPARGEVRSSRYGGDLEPEDTDISLFYTPKSARLDLSVGWSTFLERPEILGYQVSLDEIPFARIASQEGDAPKIAINYLHPFFSEEAIPGYGFMEEVVEATWYAHRGDYDIPSIEGDVLTVSEPSAYAGGQWTENAGTTLLATSVIPAWNDPIQISRGSAPSEYREMLVRVESLLTQLVTTPGLAVLDTLNGLRYLGPLRVVPERNHVAPIFSRREQWANGLGAWNALMRNHPLGGDGPSLVDRCSEYLHETLGLPYTLRREDRIQVPAGGELFSQLRLMSTRFADCEEDDLRRIVLQMESLERIPTIQLHDEKNDVDVGPMDIGVGVSQSLPVVVGAVEPNCTIFAVEQPELHIHPAVQVNLADVFLREILEEGKRPRMFLLETHSEHLVLRIMRRIRETCEGKLPAGFPPVTPDQVAVLYVETVDGRTCVREMPLNERGELVKAWPGGFFEEGLRETL